MSSKAIRCIIVVAAIKCKSTIDSFGKWKYTKYIYITMDGKYNQYIDKDFHCLHCGYALCGDK